MIHIHDVGKWRMLYGGYGLLFGTRNGGGDGIGFRVDGGTEDGTTGFGNQNGTGPWHMPLQDCELTHMVDLDTSTPMATLLIMAHNFHSIPEWADKQQTKEKRP